MYPRLRLARNLLRDDGVVFVSIDDHEVHNLRVLMGEVFGEENFVATVIWQKVYSPKNTARHFSEDHDYIIVYAKDIIVNSASGWYTQSMLTYDEVKDHPREFLAATGLTRDEFERLSPIYRTSYTQQYPTQLTAKGKVRQRQPGGGAKGTLRHDEDRLLFSVRSTSRPTRCRRCRACSLV